VKADIRVEQGAPRRLTDAGQVAEEGAENVLLKREVGRLSGCPACPEGARTRSRSRIRRAGSSTGLSLEGQRTGLSDGVEHVDVDLDELRGRREWSAAKGAAKDFAVQIGGDNGELAHELPTRHPTRRFVVQA
jgi:hypothetical protein